MLETKRSWPLTSFATAFFAGALVMAQFADAQEEVPLHPAPIPVDLGGEFQVDGEVIEAASIVVYPSTDDWTVAEDTFVPQADDSMYLEWPNVREELELAEDQIRQIKEAQDASYKAINKYLQENQSNGQALDHKKMQQFMHDNQQKSRAAINAALLPHQQRRLKQVALQLRMKHQGVSAALMSKEVAEELGLDEAEYERFQKAAQNARIEMEKEYARLRAAFKEKLLNELTETQRAKLKKLAGDEMKSHSFANAAKTDNSDTEK